ncbi:MAG: 2-phospho-L-lactate transferase [Asgard group archaeon]|nr:2-phospho-L-lactate transferase [Asgard group archaeon]
MTDDVKITFLSGGTGTPKLLIGFREILSEDNMTIIGNIGDDDEFYGLLVSPDIDTLLYLFSNQLDVTKFWGVNDDTFSCLEQTALLGEESWFQLGDKDIALHLLRNKLMTTGLTHSQAIAEISRRLGIRAKIIPISDDSVRTKLITSDDNYLSFQEYTVKYKEKPEIKAVIYEGSKKAKPVLEVEEVIENSKTIIIGPSNPVTSINPMLSIFKFKTALTKTKGKVIAVSPIEGDQAFSGPAARLMKGLKMEPNALGIATLYRKFLNTFFISEADEKLAKKIEKLGIKVICTNISLKTHEERVNLAYQIMQEIEKSD